MAAGEGTVPPGVESQSPIMPSGWGESCDDRMFTVLRRQDADGEGDSGLLGRDKTAGDATTRELCALHLPKRTWIVKFDEKPIGYFYINKEWDSSHRCYPLCTCKNGDIIVPSDAFLGYSGTETYKSNQINCWRFFPMYGDSSVRSILTEPDYPIFLRQQLESKGLSAADIDRCVDELAQYISEPGAGDATSRIVKVNFAYDATVMVGHSWRWLEDGNRSLYGIFAPTFFEDYRIYPFDVERRNTWVSVGGRSFCVGLRYKSYFADPLSPQEYKTVRTSTREFDDERPVVFLPVSSEFATYNLEFVRGSPGGWEARYTNYPAGQGVLGIYFNVPVAGTYKSGIGLMQNGQFFYNDYFDVRNLDEHSGPFTGTDYVMARFSVEYDVETLEIERIEGARKSDENVVQDWFSSGGRYLGTEARTTTYPENIESHITFERL